MPSHIPNVESGKFSTSKKNFYSKITWIGTFCRVGKFSIFIGKTSTLVKIFSLFWTSKRAQIQSKWRNWKIFHFSGKFSTSKNLQKKNFFCRIAWIGTFCRGRKFSTFGGKFSTLVKFYFRHLDLRVCQISSPKEKLEFFPLWWKIFHLQKCAPKKNFFLQNCMNWNILQRELFSEKSEIFPLFPKTRKFGKFIYSGLQLDKVSAKIIFSKNGHPSSGILSEIFQFLSLKSEFFLIFWKKVTIFENSEILYTLAYKCAKFQQNRRNFFSSFIIIIIIIIHHSSRLTLQVYSVVPTYWPVHP